MIKYYTQWLFTFFAGILPRDPAGQKEHKRPGPEAGPDQPDSVGGGDGDWDGDWDHSTPTEQCLVKQIKRLKIDFVMILLKLYF